MLTFRRFPDWIRGDGSNDQCWQVETSGMEIVLSDCLNLPTIQPTIQYRINLGLLPSYNSYKSLLLFLKFLNNRFDFSILNFNIIILYIIILSDGFG